MYSVYTCIFWERCHDLAFTNTLQRQWFVSSDTAWFWKLQEVESLIGNTALVVEIYLMRNLVGFHCNSEARIVIAILFQFYHSVILHRLIKYDYFGKIVCSSDCQFESNFLDNILTDDIARLCKVTNLFLSRSHWTTLRGNILTVMINDSKWVWA